MSTSKHSKLIQPNVATSSSSTFHLLPHKPETLSQMKPPRTSKFEHPKCSNVNTTTSENTHTHTQTHTHTHTCKSKLKPPRQFMNLAQNCHEITTPPTQNLATPPPTTSLRNQTYIVLGPTTTNIKTSATTASTSFKKNESSQTSSPTTIRSTPSTSNVTTKPLQHLIHEETYNNHLMEAKTLILERER